MHISNAQKYKSAYVNMPYYGVIKDIWELNYIMFHHIVFQCKWVENNNGIKIDELEFTQVILTERVTKRAHSYWHFKQNKYFISQILLIKMVYCAINEAK